MEIEWWILSFGHFLLHLNPSIHPVRYAWSTWVIIRSVILELESNTITISGVSCEVYYWNFCGDDDDDDDDDDDRKGDGADSDDDDDNDDDYFINYRIIMSIKGDRNYFVLLIIYIITCSITQIIILN